LSLILGLCISWYLGLRYGQSHLLKNSQTSIPPVTSAEADATDLTVSPPTPGNISFSSNHQVLKENHFSPPSPPSQNTPIKTTTGAPVPPNPPIPHHLTKKADGVVGHLAPTNPHLTIYKGAPIGSSITIKGDSTTHKWTMIGKMISGTLELESGMTLNTSLEKLPLKDDGILPATATAAISVRSIHSTANVKPDIMDGLYQEALKETQFPQIVYTLDELKLKDGHVAGQPFEFESHGELSISGVTNKISMPVTIVTNSSNPKKILLSGSIPLKMTTFGITPPAPNIGLGLMKCADDVEIEFAWSLMQVTPQ